MNDKELKEMRKQQQSEFKEAYPVVRSLAAFAVYLRWGLDTLDCYQRVDEFIGVLEKDLKHG